MRIHPSGLFVALLLTGVLSGTVRAQPLPAPAAERAGAQAAAQAAADEEEAAPKGTLPGQLSSKFPIDRRDPESSVPSVKDRNHNPLEFGYFLQDLLAMALEAQKANDFDGGIRYYRAIAKAVPDRAKSWSKLCEAYEAAKDRDRAVRACKYAIDREGVELQDYVRYVHLILSTASPLTADESKELTAVLDHLDKQQSTAAGISTAVAEMRCELGVKTSNVALLETCTTELQAKAPNDSRTVVFAWHLAVMKGQTSEARKLIDQARKAGVLAESIERMQAATSGGRLPRNIAVVVVAALLGLGGAMLWMRRRRAVPHRLAR